MSKKKRPGNSSPLVYSTDPNFRVEEDAENEELLSPGEQVLRIWLETRHRGGKTATVVRGFRGPVEELEKLAKALKNNCGTGGSAKDGEMIIQGDHRDKVLQYLLKNGYVQTKKAG